MDTALPAAPAPAPSTAALALSGILAGAGIVARPAAHEIRAELGAVLAVAVSRDGQRLALGGGNALVVDVASGDQVAAFDHPRAVTSVALDEDGSCLATACGDSMARVWDVRSGACVELVHEARVLSVYLGADGQRLAAGCDNGVTHLHDLSERKVLLSVSQRSEAVQRVYLSDDGSWLLTEGPGGTDMWCARTGAHRTAFRPASAPGQAGGATAGRCLVFGVDGRSAWVGHCLTGRVMRTLRHPATVHAAYPDASATRVATACADENARIWDVERGACDTVLHGHSGAVHDVVFSGGRVFTGSEDQTARAWHAQSGRCLRVYTGDGMAVIALALARDGTSLFVAGYGSQVPHYDLRSGRCVRRFAGHTGWIGALALSHDGTRLATGGHDGTARVWDIDGSGCLAVFDHREVVHAVCFGAADRTLYAAGRDRRVRAWDLATGGCRRTFDGTVVVRCLALHPSAATLVAGDQAGFLHWWNVDSGQCERTVRAHHDSVHAVRFSADGKWLFSVGADGVATRWSAGGEARLSTNSANSSGLRGLWVSDDGARLVTGGFDGAVRTWNVRTGQSELAIPDAHTDWVRAVLLTPDGRRIVSGGKDGRIHFWDAQTGRPLATLFNLQDGFLWTTPADPVAPCGWLWTDREDRVRVFEPERAGAPARTFGADDPRRAAYLGTYNSQREVLRRLDLSGDAPEDRLAQLTAIHAGIGRVNEELLRLTDAGA
jgi:WD40 repeat protein